MIADPSPHVGAGLLAKAAHPTSMQADPLQRPSPIQQGSRLDHVYCRPSTRCLSSQISPR
ncbi:hypothetical protein EPZ47_11910 [Pseudomonas viciae]|uniref:Uncharacterized protein n=1 Tax=Pseudomonas viciae TaxID=2505979 RepID=A0A4P7PGN7_9PSED|nr:hypothetical protein EPZ47_11910 [Pseudomonas viciae]